ncbi:MULTISPECIES: amino acid ABC transporter permease [unclassified Herbaspirillum]|uniref:amino acid ABC transporter permease n=1 Tax=unclassified Herbaspirillum TaxID=2624150 RepID=UPI001170F2B1|nr:MULTISPECIES: amino acid ABC transporter permease [unclassified Herbaspirillum]MBB5393069.1 cystine transport system permease protein [Herbaspirillum sp. SJZ102]TQK04288.1 amino acid ABC transporter membrane protein (PAAT family) [Herbaspirillum sp. SJZ130]TQK09927.1 amino acid ABC transporter membrane protein (PAAT family) [Herbaspirillum sp. SJZ106]TWC65750.1 amino acid ABC transporter membrane protein (PAAT family) [Herbaspirillum sp. SJZ099]
MEIVELLQQAAPTLMRGVGYTLLFALSSMIGGLALGFVLAVARIVPWRPVQWPAVLYVSLMRGTPLLVQIFVVYYGLPSVGIEFSPLAAGVLTLSLNAGAYLSESLRGAILGVTRGQWNAAYSIGLTYFQTLRFIIVPQAVRIAVPAMSNTLLSLIKDTSLVSVITVTELMLATKEVIAVTFRPLPLYIAAACIYWALSLCFEALQHRLEKKLGKAHQS